MIENKNGVDEVAALAVAASDPDRPFIGLPDDYELHDLEAFGDKPRRVKVLFTAADPKDLEAYVEEFGDEFSTAFSNRDNAACMVIIDYHEDSDKPQWASHRAKLQLETSTAFGVIAGSNNNWMEQGQFAQFLEKNQDSFTNPTGAKLLEIAMNLMETKTVKLHSATNLKDGSRAFTFDDSKRVLSVAVPRELELRLPVFDYTAPVALKALMRYRTDDGMLRFKYELIEEVADIKKRVFEAVDDHLNLGVTRRFKGCVFGAA